MVNVMNPGSPNRNPNKPGGASKPGGAALRVAETREEVYRKYAWVLTLISEDETGSLRGFFDWVVKKYVDNARSSQPLPAPITEAEFERKLNETAWKQQYDSFEAQARIERADPRLRQDWIRSVQTRRNEIQRIAEEYGVVLSETELDNFAEQSRLQNWDLSRIRNALTPVLERNIAEGGDLTGTAGDIQTQLSQWAARQGINIPDDTLRRLITSGALGRQSLEDMKAEIRRMYLRGAYPNWANEIDAGADPYDLAAPYRVTLASLLELNDEEIGLDDPLLSEAMQTGMTLTDLKRKVRTDPRWQATDNAYQTYTNVGTELLSMFGFR